MPAAGGRAAQCNLIGKAGLIGLHVIRKTETGPQWVWSTFEHVDNVPPAGKAAAAGIDYTLFNRQCELPDFKPTELACASQRPGILPPPIRPGLASQRAQCCANLQIISNSRPHMMKEVLGLTKPPGKSTNSNIPKLLNNHVTRLDPIGDSAAKINAAMQALIKRDDASNPLQNYVLVNTQWPGNARDQKTGAIHTLSCFQLDAVGRTDADCYKILPRNSADKSLRLRNTTMETFQVSIGDGLDAKHFSSAGCLNCHGDAGVDFSFVFLDGEEIPTPLPAKE